MCSIYDFKTNAKILKGENNFVKDGKAMLLSFTEITSEHDSHVIKLATATASVPVSEKQNGTVNEVKRKIH